MHDAMTSSPPELAYWLALAYGSDLNLARVKDIVATWCLERGQPLAALSERSLEELVAQLGLSEEEGEQLVAAANRVSEQATWLARLESDGTQLITRADPCYPGALVRGFPPAMQPLLLFCRGDVGMLSRPSAAVIGAQDAGVEMADLARALATLLVEEGLVVVSGLGKGVGQAAFDAALSAEGGQAVAVLPMGINAFSGMPDRSNQMTAAVEEGRSLLLSPFHPEAKFTEAQAIARNKLIVRLVGAVFVVAAGEGDVARETANEALGLGKTVYVWDTDPAFESKATGNQALIQAGALPIGGVSDILDAVEAVVATALELTELAKTSAAISLPAATQVREIEAAYDPQAVLDLLSEAGRVPDALARRLRGGLEGKP
jgi:predicted Rossmann fold nucleotide-binding protein DprA/Smf involved in DNA uptake